MKAATFLSACLFVFSASADYVWPTATTGKDGNMASNGADGWNGGMPNGTGTTWFYGAGTYTPYLSCGTELFLSPTVCLRNRSSVDESHVTLDISGLGTHMIFHKLQLGDSGDRADSTMKLYVHDGAKVSVTNSLVTKGKNCFFEFRDNAVLDVSSISTPVYLGDSGGSWGPGTGNFTVTNNFLFTDSEMKGNTVFFGYGASWKACPLYICATNSTFKFMDKSSYQSLGKKVFNNCIHTVALSKECHVQYGADVTFDGCAITNGKWSVGNANSATADPPDSFLVVKGGSKAYLQGIAGAESANSTGRILIADPGTEVSMGGATSVYGYTDLGKKGNCYVVVTNGAALRTAGDFTSVQPIRLGVDGGSYGEFIVCGGECTMTNTFGFWVGCSGDGELRVSDGLVRLNRMTVGYNGASTYTRTALVRQTGGTILIDNGGTIDNNGNNAVVLGKVARPSEIRLEGGVFETGSIYSDNRASAVLVGDGGILRRSHADYVSGYSKTKKFVYGLSAVQCGASGLTIDTNGKDVSVDGDFTNKAGDDGVLVKTGAGVMSLKNAAYDVAKTVVCGGTLLLDGASSVLSTDLCVTNDGVFSLVGSATTVTLTGLSIDRGTVAIDPGDKIVVDGRADLSRLKVEFSSLPAVDQEADFLVVDGELSAASQSALRKALFLNVLADGTHGAFAFSYDEGTGKTTVKIAVKTDAPLSDTTQWNGADGSWSVGGNWSAGLPTAAKVAVFTDDSSSAAVSIPSGATVGALSFGGQAYTLSGEALSIPSEEGSAMLTVASGSHEISAPLVVDSTMRVVVETNSAIAVSGSVNGGGVKKTGGGKLSLGADNAFLRPVVLSEGTLAAMTSGALGCSAESDNVVGLASGTLEVTNSTGLATTLGQDIRVVATNATEPVVLKTDTDVVVSSLSVSQGAILKHGRGRLVLQAKDGRTLVPNNWEVVANTTAMVYSASGSVYPRSDGSNRYFYAPLTVSEGEFLLKGTPGEDSTETVKGTVFVGRYVGQGLAGASSMTIDGATLSMPNQIFYLGYSMSDSGDGLDSVLRIVNGGKLNAGRLVLGEYCFGKYVETLA
ncbi:MAG: hypothetical protein IJG13_00330, partial [Kiritimatiellae bacterium]|nr:hypothetical protein [Kiritimatiellia bacterium]